MKRINRLSCLLLSFAAMFLLSAGSIAHAGTPDICVDNSSDDGSGSLRDAIDQANQQPGSTILITADVTEPINLTSGELSISADMTICNVSELLVEIRQSTTDARVFHVSGPCTLDVNITGGSDSTPLVITGGSVREDHGGGILVDTPGNVLTLSYVHVVGNSAVSSSPGDDALGTGGGIFSMGSVTLNTSIVEDNCADLGGGG